MISCFVKNRMPKSMGQAFITGQSNSNSGNHPEMQFVGIDVFKFFFAVCVVALHTNALSFLPYSLEYMITRAVFRIAVPYFFVASGFFVGKKLNNTPKEQYQHVIRSYCLRLLKPLIVFEIISLIYYGLINLLSGKSIVSTILLLGRSVVFYPYGALWYVQASIIGLLLLYPFLKKDKLNVALVIGVFLYIFALLANNYSFIIANTPFEKVIDTYLKHCVSARNGLFTGFISISIGIFCSKIYKKICQNTFTLKLCAILLYCVYISEILLVYYFNKTPLDDGSLYISHLVFIPALFFVTLQLNLAISSKTAVLFRNLSTGVYFLHRPILYVSDYFISTGWVNFIVVLCCCILICLFTYKTKLKYLYSLLK